MTDIFKYTCDVRDVNHRYQMIHNEIFSLSLRKLVTAIVSDQSVSLKNHADELYLLHGKLMDIQTDLDVLPQSELKIPRGNEILSTLSDYITALTKSIDYLQKICIEKSRSPVSDSSLTEYRTVYDDAIQHHKTLGVRLNGLLSSF